ncbi:GNAT superfamily N-acetyltransferase [Sphingomonas zeicaulis]|uniref:GNAT family N-acetyltransferase n=1 Tax=Sphingomonas zeicaulis TaxID=1632740 RepID=UPI003D206866
MTARLDPLTPADFASAGALARIIWHTHYDPLIGAAQVDYMLDRRFTEAGLAAYVDAADRGFDLLRDGEALVGYCSYGPSGAPGELKLEQLYLLPERHGQGLGRLMIAHVEARAGAFGCDRIMLMVAKANTGSKAVYERAGFSVRGPVTVDIGGGFVMDDYVMEKRLG